MFYWIKTNSLIKKIFSHFVWDIPNTENKIYLTFDDGPTPEITEWVLDELKKHNAKATFFCIGKNIEAHPEIFAKIINEGHSIGNHTFNHPNGWKITTEDYLENTKRCEETIRKFQISNSKFQIPIPIAPDNYRDGTKSQTPNSNPDSYRDQIPNSKFQIPKTKSARDSAQDCNLQPAICNLQSKLFRPPYGKLKRSQSKGLRKLGYKIIMWDVLSADFDRGISPEKCLENATEKATSGSIIVFHDSKKASKNTRYALPKAIEFLKEKGFVFDTL